MARQKLTIVVTCTDRKFFLPAPDLTARTLPLASVNERAAEWRRRLNNSVRATPLSQLYKGESWAQARRLIQCANGHGYDTDFLVASAGLGLRRVDDLAASYSATFTFGQADSVATSAADASRWWDLLPHQVSAVQGPSLWVLSSAYAKAMRNTLSTLDPSDSLVFGGSAGIAEPSRVASDRALRSELGGTATSLNLRMAIQWLELAADRSPWAPETRSAWRSWAGRVRMVERYDRTPTTDEAVRTFLVELRKHDPSVSKTRALRTLRSSGVACEQRRFSNLFEEVVNS